MFDGLPLLLGLGAVMAIASFLAGSLPISFSLTPRQLRLTTALGSGVLVGTALIVIIPEGVATIYGANSATSLHVRRADNNPSDLTGPPVPPQSKNHNGRQARPDPHAWVGLALILGFILMYLIDVLPRHPTPSRGRRTISLANLSRGAHHADDSPSMNATAGPSSSPPPLSPISGAAGGSSIDEDGPPTRSAREISRAARSTTVGLVIHSLSDGIALGASTLSSPDDGASSLSLVVFLALMLHKAPAAFGLTSVLLKKGVGKRTARTHLAVFSLAAPAGALGTWILAQLIGMGWLAPAGGDEKFGTGVLLIFSGGTFLYVATHALMPSDSTPAHTHDGFRALENGYTSANRGSSGDDVGAGANKPISDRDRGIADTAAAVAGMLLPMIAQLGHVH